MRSRIARISGVFLKPVAVSTTTFLDKILFFFFRRIGKLYLLKV